MILLIKKNEEMPKLDNNKSHNSLQIMQKSKYLIKRALQLILKEIVY